MDLLASILSFYKSTDPLNPPSVQIGLAIKATIVQGLMKDGSTVPSTTQLANILSVNPMTAIKALRIIADEGIIKHERGKQYSIVENAREIVEEQIEVQMKNDVKYLYRKMKNFKIPQSTIVEWLKEYRNAEKPERKK